MDAYARKDQWSEQLVANEQMDRGALGLTIRIGEQVEMSNGVTIVYSKFKGMNSIQIVIIAPKDVGIYRPIRDAELQR